MSESRTASSKFSYLAALVAAATSIIAGVITFTASRITKIEIGSTQLELSPKERIERKYLDDFEKQIVAIKAQIDGLTNIPADAPVSAKLNELEAFINTINKKITAIDNAILQSPEKALEIPMLKRDIQALQKQYENATNSLEREMSRAYDTIKWVIGTIVLGLLGLAVSVFLRERQVQERQE